MIRSSLRQSNHPPDCCWPSTNCTRRVCDSCNRPATVEATPAMRPKEAYPKVLAEKEKKVENTNCRATGKTTNSVKKAHWLGTSSSSPYTIDIMVTTINASRGRFSTYLCYAERVSTPSKHLRRVPAPSSLRTADHARSVAQGTPAIDRDRRLGNIEHIPSKARGRAEHHRDEAKRQNDVERILELRRQARIGEKLFHLLLHHTLRVSFPLQSSSEAG